MTRTKSTYLALVAILLSPMAALADLITYTGGALSDGSYVTAEVELTGTAEGVYDLYGGDLISFMLNVYDATDNLLLTFTDADLYYDFFNSFVHIDAGGQLDEWWIFSQTVTESFAYTVNSTGQYITNCCEPYAYDEWWDGADGAAFGRPSGTWQQVPEPGTLALLTIGLFGMGLARRRRKV